jgi:hypothetical protein
MRSACESRPRCLHPSEADKKNRHFAERNFEIRAVSRKCALRHTRCRGFIRVLNNADATRCLNLPETGSPIAAATRQDNAYDARAINAAAEQKSGSAAGRVNWTLGPASGRK